MCFEFDWQVFFINTSEDFLFIGKPLLNHATIAWFSFAKEKAVHKGLLSFLRKSD